MTDSLGDTFEAMARIGNAKRKLSASAPLILYCTHCRQRTEHRDTRDHGVVYSTCSRCGGTTKMEAR